MALIRCPECREKISSKSEACIHCGYPVSFDSEEIKEEEKLANNLEETIRVKNRTWTIYALVCVGVISFISIMGSNESTETTASVPEVKISSTVKAPIIDKSKELERIKAEEQRLYEEVKKVPASQIYKNRDMYKKLTELAPGNDLYRQKLKFYSNQIELAEGSSKNVVSDTLKILTPGTRARLCPVPNCGQNQHLTRISEGTALKINEIKEVQNGYFTAQWFKVNYQGKTGWVSMYDTDKQ